MIERVQNRFLRVIAFKTGKIGVFLENIASEYEIEFLEKRRKFHYVSWLHKLLNYSIICPELYS